MTSTTTPDPHSPKGSQSPQRKNGRGETGTPRRGRSATGEAGAPRRGRPSVKRAVILEGARAVFGRDGYARASIDAIAAEAGVSTRTIYNHFPGKENLFAAVIEDSAAHVRDAQLALLEQHFAAMEEDPETGLIALGKRWVAIVDEFAEHFAIVRHIHADAQHIPAALLKTWRETGPEPVQAELARKLADLAEAGVLRVTDPQRAAIHYTQLIAGEINTRTFHGALPLAQDEVETIVIDGVRAFLHGYATRTPQ